MDHLDEVIRDFRNLAGFVSVRRFSRLVLSGFSRRRDGAYCIARAISRKGRRRRFIAGD